VGPVYLFLIPGVICASIIYVKLTAMDYRCQRILSYRVWVLSIYFWYPVSFVLLLFMSNNQPWITSVEEFCIINLKLPRVGPVYLYLVSGVICASIIHVKLTAMEYRCQRILISSYRVWVLFFYFWFPV
jgi:hypothetical protein